MDDSCAVCAESLEWVAYGPCGHREVCSTCVARLRFICDDGRCCICKTESNVVFITKALGDYTRMIVDFSIFPSNPTEGQNGSYWYHEDTGAYFDDSDHYKMIKAMCRLSCSVCDKMEDQGGNDGPKRRAKFRNIEQLKNHLYHRHKLHMCSLCLEGRKIFICEQKLYTRSQLNQHINTGDSEVDGSESERGGFMGHPMCEFCKKPFYGDNELYTHMSTEHFTCHICQRQHPGQYEYYKNYDDLETHFRHQHFLCEDEACLAKKFIVFQSESEMKRHNAIEHGGNMSRSKRNAVLQIPTSFRYRRSNEQDHRRGRGRGLRPDSSENQLSLAIQASLETANVNNSTHDSSSTAQQVPDHSETCDIDEIISPFESLATTDAEVSARYLQALGQSSRNAPLEESSFPPLPMAPASIKQKPKHDSEGLGKSTMAARLRRRSNGTVHVLNSAQAWSATNQGLASSSSSSSAQSWSKTSYGLSSSSSSATSLHTNSAITNGPVPSSYASSSQARPATGHVVASTSSASSPWNSSSSARPAGHGVPSASSASSLWNSSSSARISHSASAPNLVDRGSLDSSVSDFPPVSATRKNKLPTNSQPILKVEDVHTANKSLVEMIRSALGSDENKYSAFKEISSEYRQGVINTGEYLYYVQQFGLSHLVLELARLCPDAKKQRELIETYNASVKFNSMEANGLGSSGTRTKVSKGSQKGKGKSVEEADSSSRDTLADNILSTVRKLQASYKPSEEDVEVLSKDGYRVSKGKTKASIVEDQLGLSSARKDLANSDDQNSTQSGSVGSKTNSGGGGGKQRKKIPKFARVRLGDVGQSDFGSEHEEETSHSMENPSEGLSVRGVWRNGGGQRLVTKTQKSLGK